MIKMLLGLIPIVLFANNCDNAIDRLKKEEIKYNLSQTISYKISYENALINVIGECEGAINTNEYKLKFRKLKEKKKKNSLKDYDNKATFKFQDEPFLISMLSENGFVKLKALASYDSINKNQKKVIRNIVIKYFSSKTADEISLLGIDKINQTLQKSIANKATNYKVYSIKFEK